MSGWTLGVHGLPSAEAGLVRALLTLVGGGDPGWRWKFAPSGPCDVLLADAAATAPQQVQSERSARALLLLGGGAAPYPRDCLRRPLRPDELEAALRRLGSQLHPDADPQPAAAERMAPPAAAGARYKLLRWPPAALLHGDPARLRMATHLTRRFLSGIELATLTGQEPARCVVFLQLLQNFQLLQPEAAAAPTASQRPAAASAPAASWSLVRSIRRRLGL